MFTLFTWRFQHLWKSCKSSGRTTNSIRTSWRFLAKLGGFSSFACIISISFRDKNSGYDMVSCAMKKYDKINSLFLPDNRDTLPPLPPNTKRWRCQHQIKHAQPTAVKFWHWHCDIPRPGIFGTHCQVGTVCVSWCGDLHRDAASVEASKARESWRTDRHWKYQIKVI